MNTLGGSTVGVDSRVARCTLLPRNWLVVAPARPPYPAQLAVCKQLYAVIQSPCTLATGQPYPEREVQGALGRGALKLYSVMVDYFVS